MIPKKYDKYPRKDLTPEHSKRNKEAPNYKLHVDILAAYKYVDDVLDTSDFEDEYAWGGWAIREAFLAGISYKENKQQLIYLSCPYTHPFPDVVESRFNSANKAAADMMKHGLCVFSPISHTHPIAKAGELPTDWAYWEKYDRRMLAARDKVVVLKLDGWVESKGVCDEIAIADELGIPVEYIIEQVLHKKIKLGNRVYCIDAKDTRIHEHYGCVVKIENGGAFVNTNTGEMQWIDIDQLRVR